MYGLPSDYWKELSLGRRSIAQLCRCFPARQRLRLCALPADVISVADAGSTVEEVVSRGGEGLYRLAGGWVWTRGAHLDSRARIVSEISPGVNRPPAWWFVRRQKFFPPVVNLDGTVFSMIGDAAENLYHWTFDVLPRLRLLDPARRKQVRILVRLVHPFHRACLEAAGFPPSSLIPANSMTFYHVKELLAVKFIKGVTADNLACVREIYMKAAGPVPEAKVPVRLYISRARATSRRIVNEEALLQMIGPHGFRTVYLETLSLPEQLALFRDAEAIIAPTGAALTHIHMSDCRTKLLIMMPHGCDDFLCRDMAEAAGIAAELLDVPLAPGIHPDPVKADLFLDEACLSTIRSFVR